MLCQLRRGRHFSACILAVLSVPPCSSAVGDRRRVRDRSRNIIATSLNKDYSTSSVRRDFLPSFVVIVSYYSRKFAADANGFLFSCRCYCCCCCCWQHWFPYCFSVTVLIIIIIIIQRWRCISVVSYCTSNWPEQAKLALWHAWYIFC